MVSGGEVKWIDLVIGLVARWQIVDENEANKKKQPP